MFLRILCVLKENGSNNVGIFLVLDKVGVQPMHVIEEALVVHTTFTH